MQLELIATAAFGLEAVVARELMGLGYQTQVVGPGHVLFSADESGICRANIRLRVADRVLVRLGTFEATDFGQLFDRTHALPWERWIGPDGAFPVNGRSRNSQLSSVPACQKIVKKAIVEKLRSAHGVETLPETGPKYSVEVALAKDRATLSIDTTGPSLHKRGYRPLSGAAPLKETLAAAMVMLSFWRPGRPLIDPFCGTGTIPIEAAMIGRNLAPGLHRPFRAGAWPNIGPGVWKEAIIEARDLALANLPERVVGTDLDGGALRQARFHAERAGVADDIHFEGKPFSRLSSKRQFGCVVTNPPYGRRMGREPDVEALYREMPDVLRRLRTWSHYVLTSHSDLEQLVGRPADRRRKLFNGRIQCTYFQFHGPEPGSKRPADTKTRSVSEEPLDIKTRSVSEEPLDIKTRSVSEEPDRSLADASGFDSRESPDIEPVAQAFGGLNDKTREQAQLFHNRLAKRARHLRRWPTRQGITCYRLYERDIPEIPLVVDRYEDCLHVTEYERPHDRSPGHHADWLDLMAKTASDTLDVRRGNIFVKRRQRQRGTRQHERVAGAGRTEIVREGGLEFEVNLSDYVDTGLFLDHRIARSMVRSDAAGRRVLNLFGYTGAFTVYAAAGGAASTVTVDLSKTYLDWAERNMRLNGLDPGAEHRFVGDDAVDFLAHHRPGAHYDLAVVDPPTFSNSKKTERFWEVQRDHAALLARLIPLMAPGGVVYFSTNFRRFQPAWDASANVAIHEISKQTVPPDFRNRRVHRCWRMVLGK